MKKAVAKHNQPPPQLLLPRQRLQALRQVHIEVARRFDTGIAAGSRRMIPCCNNDGLGRLFTHHADSLGHLSMPPRARRSRAEMIGVEVRRRGLPVPDKTITIAAAKACHGAIDTTQNFRICIGACRKFHKLMRIEELPVLSRV